MSASMSQDMRAEPNLVPILDMVFQLITFFMLVFNLKAETVDASLNLPVIGSARPPGEEERETVVLNIDKEGKLTAYGEVQSIEKYIFEESQKSLKDAQKKNPSLKAGEELPTTIVIRADKSTPFGYLNKVIEICQTAGFRKYQYRAMNAPSAPAEK